MEQLYWKEASNSTRVNQNFAIKHHQMYKTRNNYSGSKQLNVILYQKKTGKRVYDKRSVKYKSITKMCTFKIFCCTSAYLLLPDKLSFQLVSNRNTCSTFCKSYGIQLKSSYFDYSTLVLDAFYCILQLQLLLFFRSFHKSTNAKIL